ncbi:sigma-70 family RNA polymerase sigma factor [Diaminobutyricibacter tongyongensis]|uniref:Sigma-70 family RNA polymerase sigma factor n=1 Tax=Leifsonia tongyongensis TaxID=1268043 RepID=A0A6L9Y0E3_9MICO|nr:sigma-70 family RNA polymerase sigma factor [Diaminobutyricibacter tongyongensis]
MTTELESAFREDWPIILGAVVRYTGDLQLAEDSVQEAFVRALASEADGAVVSNPSAWITTVARRIAVDTIRKGQTLARTLPALATEALLSNEIVMPDETFTFTGDERLELILLVCHPDLAEEARVAMALRFVCGVATRDIAAVFLVSESTMAARLTRAKKRIRDSEARFAFDDEAAVAARVPDALTTLYLLYTVGHAAPEGSPLSTREFRRDAIALARDLVRLAPSDPEASGLLALLLLTEARQGTRFDADGELRSLEEADRAVWDRRAIDEGVELATRSLPGRGRFALQAGIAGLHALAPTWRATDWTMVARLYDRLIEVWPSPSAQLSRIVARGYSDDVGPEAALAELDAVAGDLGQQLRGQAAAVRGDLLRRSDAPEAAVVAYREAISVEPNDRVRRFLERRVAELGG